MGVDRIDFDVAAAQAGAKSLIGLGEHMEIMVVANHNGTRASTVRADDPCALHRGWPPMIFNVLSQPDQGSWHHLHHHNIK